jgi:predicted transcriptional regulator
VSRGLGSLQRNVLAVLEATEGGELAMRELHQRLGGPDRSNTRRAVRGLLRRGFVEKIREGVGSRLSITFSGELAASYALYRASDEWADEQPDSIKELRRKYDEFRGWVIECRREERRLRDEKRALFPRWVGYPYRPVRSPGDTQRTIIAVLWEYSDPLDAGLSVLALKRIVGGDRSNARRAIRGLLRYGYFDQTPDGERLRISESLLNDYAGMMFPTVYVRMLADAPDGEWARQVLWEHGEGLYVVGFGVDCRENGDFFTRHR